MTQFCRPVLDAAEFETSPEILLEIQKRAGASREANILLWASTDLTLNREIARAAFATCHAKRLRWAAHDVFRCDTPVERPGW